LDRDCYVSPRLVGAVAHAINAPPSDPKNPDRQDAGTFKLGEIVDVLWPGPWNPGISGSEERTLCWTLTRHTRSRRLNVTAGLQELLDDHYELAWGFPQAGRSFYWKTRVMF
jgi:hypothetical protein